MMSGEGVNVAKGAAVTWGVAGAGFPASCSPALPGGTHPTAAIPTIQAQQRCDITSPDLPQGPERFAPPPAAAPGPLSWGGGVRAGCVSAGFLVNEGPPAMHPILFRIPLPHMPLKLWWALAAVAAIAVIFGGARLPAP